MGFVMDATAAGAHSALQLVLIVEDEAAIADLLGSYLARDGYEVALATDGEDALRDIATLKPAAVVLDVGLPGIDGIEVCRRIRAAGDWTPVLFVTARDDEVDRVLGLELGADDYISKPFSPREVVARVRAVLRRRPAASGSEPVAGSGPPAEPALHVGLVTLDPDRRRVEVGLNGKAMPVELTTTEFDLLRHLMARPGRVCPRDELLEQVWGYPPGTPTRTLDVHIAQLRAKLGPALQLRTVRGVGYSAEP
jgi:DNA-binding response OmpR family regulator